MVWVLDLDGSFDGLHPLDGWADDVIDCFITKILYSCCRLSSSERWCLLVAHWQLFWQAYSWCNLVSQRLQRAIYYDLRLLQILWLDILYPIIAACAIPLPAPRLPYHSPPGNMEGRVRDSPRAHRDVNHGTLVRACAPLPRDHINNLCFAQTVRRSARFGQRVHLSVLSRLLQ